MNVIVVIGGTERITQCQDCLGIEFRVAENEGGWRYVFHCRFCDRVKYSTRGEPEWQTVGTQRNVIVRPGGARDQGVMR